MNLSERNLQNPVLLFFSPHYFYRPVTMVIFRHTALFLTWFLSLHICISPPPQDSDCTHAPFKSNFTFPSFPYNASEFNFLLLIGHISPYL